MSGQTKTIGDLLRLRIEAVQELSAACADHHKLLQMASAADFDGLRRDEDLEIDERKEALAREIESNAALQARLAEQLERIDEELRNKKQGEEDND